MSAAALWGLASCESEPPVEGPSSRPTPILLPPPSPEVRALAYLSREVPRWSTANGCFSCHNNGDGARALLAGYRRGLVSEVALANTMSWLASPGKWGTNKGDPEFSDKRLARIQFAAALSAADEAGLVSGAKPLRLAARLVTEEQHADGFWPAGARGTLGSPITYGTLLATRMARRVLTRARSSEHVTAVRAADAWLRQAAPKNVLAAAALLLALGDGLDLAPAQEKLCLEVIRQGQSDDGGWGPYVNSPPESFDTALVLLALVPYASEPELGARVRRGREYLISIQQPDGSWRETTRPPDGESYAQRVSTTAWATLALLETFRPGKSR